MKGHGVFPATSPRLDLSPPLPPKTQFGYGVLEAAAGHVLVFGTEHRTGIAGGHPNSIPNPTPEHGGATSP